MPVGFERSLGSGGVQKAQTDVDRFFVGDAPGAMQPVTDVEVRRDLERLGRQVSTLDPLDFERAQLGGRGIVSDDVSAVTGWV